MTKKLNYGDLFSGKEVAVVKNLVNQFQRKIEVLKREDFEDLVQECLIEWHCKKDNFTFENEAHMVGFLSKFIKNKLKDLAKERTTQKRKALYQSSSLHVPLFEDSEEMVIDTIPDESNVFNSNSELDFIISEILDKLSPYQKEICLLIMEEELSDSEIAERTNKNRSTVFRERKRIKKLFEQEGLNKFL